VLKTPSNQVTEILNLVFEMTRAGGKTESLRRTEVNTSYNEN